MDEQSRKYQQALRNLAELYLPVPDGDHAVITLLVEEDELVLELTHDRVELVLYPCGTCRGLDPLPFIVLKTWNAYTIDDLMVRFSEAHGG